MEKQKKVLDVSVIFKWFSEEKDSDKALKIKDEHLAGESVIIIPSFAIIELMNALKYKAKGKDKLKEANDAIKNMQLRAVNITKFIMDKAIDNAFEYDITLYDSLYVTLSQIHGCPLITTDEDLYKTPNALALDNI